MDENSRWTSLLLWKLYISLIRNIISCPLLHETQLWSQDQALYMIRPYPENQDLTLTPALTRNWTPTLTRDPNLIPDLASTPTWHPTRDLIRLKNRIWSRHPIWDSILIQNSRVVSRIKNYELDLGLVSKIDIRD